MEGITVCLQEFSICHTIAPLKRKIFFHRGRSIFFPSRRGHIIKDRGHHPMSSLYSHRIFFFNYVHTQPAPQGEIDSR